MSILQGIRMIEMSRICIIENTRVLKFVNISQTESHWRKVGARLFVCTSGFFRVHYRFFLIPAPLSLPECSCAMARSSPLNFWTFQSHPAVWIYSPGDRNLSFSWSWISQISPSTGKTLEQVFATNLDFDYQSNGAHCINNPVDTQAVIICIDSVPLLVEFGQVYVFKLFYSFVTFWDIVIIEFTAKSSQVA